MLSVASRLLRRPATAGGCAAAASAALRRRLSAAASRGGRIPTRAAASRTAGRPSFVPASSQLCARRHFGAAPPPPEPGGGGLTLGIVRETYDKWERRAPLCPSHVRDLLAEFSDRGLLGGVLVQPASHRIFADSEYAEAGAAVTDDLSGADLILGVKQVEEGRLLGDRAYMFFAHVIKGQPENMSLMRTVLESNVQLFDYECINEEWIDMNKQKKKRRLVAFGKYAGIAGMIDAFQCLGRRLLAGGYSTPFLNCPPTYMYNDLDDAKAGVERMGRFMGRRGLPGGLEPLVFCFTGRGNVSTGAMGIFKLLPHEMITKERLSEIRNLEGPQDKVYGLQLNACDLVRRTDDPEAEFDMKHYIEHPQLYRSTFFEEVAPHINVIVNGIYWDERFPRLLTKQQIKTLYESGNTRLLAVADISCDIEGSIEFLERSTTVEQPYFEYDPITGEASDDITGDGVAMMGVDILPTELPKESSQHFGDALLPLIRRLIEAKGRSEGRGLHDLGEELPVELANACICTRGRLTPAFEYISELMRERAHAGHVDPRDPHVLIELRGHLFDSGLINQVLDVMEHADCHFEFRDCNVRRKVGGVPEKSDVLLRVSAESGDVLDDIEAKVRSLTDLIVAAEASVECFDGAPDAAGGKGKKKGKKAAAAAAAALVTSEEEQRILVLGAGRVAASLSEYLGRSSRRSVVVASQFEHEARTVADEARRGVGVALDVESDRDGLARLVGDADVVVSLLPAPMHPLVAEECLKGGTDLVTASYVSPEIRALGDRCERAGVAILNEVGLDPGMDHMSAMRIIDDVRARGGEITSFSSVCGGLPAPEAANNPLMYKFSWSPMGVLRASQNDAVYMWHGDVVNVEGKDLLSSARPFDDAWPSLHLEVLPNRDSLAYADKYGIQTATTIFRGTLRYHGFSDVLHVFKNMGLLDDVPVGGPSDSWGDVLESLREKRGCSDLRSLLLTSSGGDGAKAARAASCLRWLGVSAGGGGGGAAAPGPRGATVVESFCDALEGRLGFGEGERDMVLMHHDVRASFDDGRSAETRRSSLQLFGDGRMSAMCKTVGCTAAVGAELLLSGDLARKGILLPTSRDIYEPCLAALEREGLRFDEETIVDADSSEDLSFGA